MMVPAVAMEGQEQQRGNIRPAMNVPRHVLDSFDALVAAEDKKRTAAGLVILQHVDQILRGGVQGKELPAGVRYIMQRLVTGLASTRQSAREGYFSTLCFLLRLHPSSFKPAFILSLLNSKRAAAMKALGKEEIRDQLVAQMLLCGAIVRSGYVRRSAEVMQGVVNLLCAMRTTKSYMDVTASQFLANIMEDCEGDSMHSEVWHSLQAELQGAVADLSPSQLWLRLVLLRKHRRDPPVWLTSTLATKNHEALGQTVMKAVTGLPEVHPVLLELVTNLTASSSSSSLLVKFWGTTVEPLQGHATPGKLQILFHLLRFIIPHLKTAAVFKDVVTPSVVGLLLSSFTQHLRDLKEAAKGVTAALIQLVKDNQEEESELQLAVVRALVTSPGSVRFDQLAGNRVLALMMPCLSLTTLKGFCAMLLEVLKKPSVSKDAVAAERNYAAHILGSLLGQPRACATEAAVWRRQQLAALLKAALLTPGKEEEGDTTKDAFFKALGKQVGHIKEYKDILVSLVEEVEREFRAAAEKGGSAGGPASPSPLTEKGRQQWAVVCGRLNALKKRECEEDSEEDVARTVFQVLYSQMALHLFVDVKVAGDTIDEFITCHKEVKKLGVLDDDEEEEEEEEDDDGSVEGRPNWVELLTELLLTLMTEEVHLFRCVVQGLFWLLTPHMTRLALCLLTDVLDTNKARELLKEDGKEETDEDEEEGGSDDDDEEEDEDEEKEGVKKGKKKEGSDDSDDDEEEEEDECGEGDDPNLFTLRKKMLAAAGGIEVDVDMDSVPQEELDRMDERLGALLAEYRGKHPGKKRRKKKGKGGGGVGGGDEGPQLTQDEQALMHFQTRVCDMLIVYIKAAPNMALQVGLVIPVFKALRLADFDPRQTDLQNKLANVISALEKKKKYNTIGDITVESWKETVDEFFSLACQMPERFVSVVQSCYSQLMHCGWQLLRQDEGAATRPNNFLTLTYTSHLDTYFMKNQQLPKVQPFTEPCTYNIGGLWQVAEVLVKAAFEPSVKAHKQSQALRTLQQLYTNKTVVSERCKKEAAAVEKELFGRVVKVIESMQPPINSLYVSVIFRLLHCLLMVEKRANSDPSLDWASVRVCVESFRERISKGSLNSFRKEYNVFCEALRGFLSKKGGKKERGVKRQAEDMNGEENKDTKQQETKKKKKKENKNNKDSNASAKTTEGEKKKKKKMKKNKDTPNEENKNNDEMKKEEKKEDEEEIMVIDDDNDDDDEIEYLGKVITEETTTSPNKEEDNRGTNTTDTNEDRPDNTTEDTPKKKKKKKKNKLSDVTPVNETPEKEDNEDNKKKKKKNKNKDETIQIDDTSNNENRSEDSQEKKKKRKKTKDSDAVVILTDSTQEERIEEEKEDDEITVIKKKKKKKDKHSEGEEKVNNGGEEENNTPSSLLSEPTKKKKKNKRQNSEV